MEHSQVAEISKLLGQFCIEAGFVIPTETGLQKGILDATWPLREFMIRTGLHDYSQQAQGSDGKRIIPIKIIHEGALVDGKMSLYRPETKHGDPRLWIYGLQKYAQANQVVAITTFKDNVYVINCNSSDIRSQLENPDTILGGIAFSLDTHAPAARELLEKLKEVGARGFIPSMRNGDTGIGYTLETLLHIQANSNRSPDYKGIEIKSKRAINAITPAGRRITLFSKVPKWKISPFSACKTLETFGYRDVETNRLQLFCSVDAKRANSLGFQLEVRPEDNHLVNVNIDKIDGGKDVFFWLMGEVTNDLSAKHRETFWVSANTRRINGVEHFEYDRVKHTRRPSISTFDRLISSGGICVDLTMSEKGIRAVHDHGYLFRIYGDRFDELFPSVGEYSLKP